MATAAELPMYRDSYQNYVPGALHTRIRTQVGCTNRTPDRPNRSKGVAENSKVKAKAVAPISAIVPMKGRKHLLGSSLSKGKTADGLAFTAHHREPKGLPELSPTSSRKAPSTAPTPPLPSNLEPSTRLGRTVFPDTTTITQPDPCSAAFGGPETRVRGDILGKAEVNGEKQLKARRLETKIQKRRDHEERILAAYVKEEEAKALAHQNRALQYTYQRMQYLERIAQIERYRSGISRQDPPPEPSSPPASTPASIASSKPPSSAHSAQTPHKPPSSHPSSSHSRLSATSPPSLGGVPSPPRSLPPSSSGSSRHTPLAPPSASGPPSGNSGSINRPDLFT